MVVEAECKRMAVARDGHACSLCGRPCGEDEARRHSGPGPYGDGPMNYAAMCYGCQTWLAHQGGPAPARYVVHCHDVSAARQRVRRAAEAGLTLLWLGVFGGFGGMAAWVIAHTPRSPLWLFGSLLLVCYLLALLQRLVVRLTCHDVDGPRATEIGR